VSGFEPDCAVLGRLVRLKISAQTGHRYTYIYTHMYTDPDPQFLAPARSLEIGQECPFFDVSTWQPCFLSDYHFLPGQIDTIWYNIFVLKIPVDPNQLTFKDGIILQNYLSFALRHSAAHMHPGNIVRIGPVCLLVISCRKTVNQGLV